MSPLAETIFFVFGLVALGYLCGWTRFLRTEVGDALSDFAVAVAVPMLLFRTMVNIDFGGGLPLALWATYFPGIVVTWIMAQIVMVRVFGRDAKAAVVGGLRCRRAHRARPPAARSATGFCGSASVRTSRSAHGGVRSSTWTT